MLAKKSLETGEDIDLIPESMRAYLAMQAAESGKGLGGAFYGRTGLMGYGPGMLLGGEHANQGKVCMLTFFNATPIFNARRCLTFCVSL